MNIKRKFAKSATAWPIREVPLFWNYPDLPYRVVHDIKELTAGTRKNESQANFVELSCGSTLMFDDSAGFE